jgi:hypothetical protein
MREKASRWKGSQAIFCDLLPRLHWQDQLGRRRGSGRGGRCFVASTRFMGSLVSLRACIVTMNRLQKLRTSACLFDG